MADSVALMAQPRQERGTQAVRRLRRQGLVPGVVYGHKEETLSLTVKKDDILSAIRHNVRVLDLNLAGKAEKVLIRELQWDHLGKELLHVDFTRVSADERIIVQVPLELRGNAPGVNAGGVLDQPLHTLEIECLAISIPESIRVNISELQLDGFIHVKDLVLPAGVKAITDPEAIVVHVKQPAAAPEPGAVPVTEGAVEPEVIGRKEKEAEEEGES